VEKRRRIVGIVRAAIAMALVLISVSAAHGATGPTRLRIAVQASATASVRVVTLRCNPPGGTVVHPAQACRRLLSAGRAIFAPTPPGTACTQIYGGPEKALVTGTVAGVRVWARFSRRDGCEISRWNRVAFLFARS
jgi:hypothetical protein